MKNEKQNKIKKILKLYKMFEDQINDNTKDDIQLYKNPYWEVKMTHRNKRGEPNIIISHGCVVGDSTFGQTSIVSTSSYSDTVEVVIPIEALVKVRDAFTEIINSHVYTGETIKNGEKNV